LALSYLRCFLFLLINQVELNIEGRNVQFEIDTAIATSIDDQAGVFCSNYGAEFGVTQETLADCTQNVKRALQERLTTPSQQQEEQLPAAQVFQVSSVYCSCILYMTDLQT
jgi:hypothetical protein